MGVHCPAYWDGGPKEAAHTKASKYTHPEQQRCVLTDPQRDAREREVAPPFSSGLAASLPNQLCKLPASLRRAPLLRLLRLRSSGRFLDRRVCSLSLFALTFQAQFDEVLPKLAVVHDSSLSA
jgi:hypothetical protein